MIMTFEEAMFILQHGSSEGEQKYLLAARNVGHYIKQLCEENAELKKVLRLAVEDFQRFRCLMSSDINEEFCETALEYHCNPYDLCNSCSLSGSAKCKWRYADEAMKLIGDEENV